MTIPRLTPFESLVLFALSAILVRVMKGEGNDKRHFAIVEALWDSARYYECTGNQSERIDEIVKKHEKYKIS